MKKVFYIIKKDLLNMFRDSMLIYILLSPLIFVFLINLFLPIIQDNEIIIALNKNIDHNNVQYLQKYAKILYLNSNKEIEERVLQTDNVIGLIKNNNSFTVLLEGNENKKIIEIMQIILNNKNSPISYEQIYFNTKSSFLRDFLIVIILTMTIVFGGYIIGLLFIEEKEYQIENALKVSGSNFQIILFSRALLSIFVSFFITFLTVFLLYKSHIPYLKISITLLCGSLMGVFVGFIMNNFANNQIQALTTIKVFNIFYIAIPIVAFFIKKPFNSIFYIFPNFWIFQMFLNIFIENKSLYSFNISFLMSLITIIPFLLYSIIIQKNHSY